MTRMLKTLVVVSAVTFALPAWSSGNSNDSRSPVSAEQHAKMDTPEMRQKMAQMHERMATCLRSNRDMKECHQEMMQNCPMMKDGKCNMHGMMGMDMDGNHHDMMKGKKSAQKR